jgi:hypothetical protein
MLLQRGEFKEVRKHSKSSNHVLWGPDPRRNTHRTGATLLFGSTAGGGCQPYELDMSGLRERISRA